MRPRPGYYEDGGVAGAPLPATGGAAGNASGQELLQAVRETTAAVRALPSRQHISWGDADTEQLEDRLADRADVRYGAAIR